MKKTIILMTTALLIGSVLSAAQDTGLRGMRAPVRLNALTVNGSVVTLRLADGRSVDVPEARLRVIDRRLNSHEPAAAHSRRQQRAFAQGSVTRHSAAALRTLAPATDGSLPAIVRIRYGKDGTVKHARVELFPSGEEAAAFLQRVEQRRQTFLSAHPKQ